MTSMTPAAAAQLGFGQPEPTPAPKVVLAIVGSVERDWTADQRQAIAPIIRAALGLLRPALVISGASPGGGVDSWGLLVAAQEGYDTQAYPAKYQRWEGKGGFRDRNLQMAKACTHLLAIRSVHSVTYGSGWTADRAEQLSKTVSRVKL